LPFPKMLRHDPVKKLGSSRGQGTKAWDTMEAHEDRELEEVEI